MRIAGDLGSEEGTQDRVLGVSAAFRDWSVLSNPSQDYVLGYSEPTITQSSLNKAIAARPSRSGCFSA
jgi:hypothetical protein